MGQIICSCNKAIQFPKDAHKLQSNQPHLEEEKRQNNVMKGISVITSDPKSAACSCSCVTLGRFLNLST